MKKRWMSLVTIACLCAGPAAANPPEVQVRQLERAWQGGLGPQSWSQLEELEKLPRAEWPKGLQIRFFLQRARMTAIRHRDRAEQNLKAALELCETPTQRCQVLLARAQLERRPRLARAAYQEALSTFLKDEVRDLDIEAELALEAGTLARHEEEPSPEAALHFLHAARLYESAGRWTDATRAWCGLLSLPRGYASSSSDLKRAEFCARKSNDTNAWLQLALLGNDGHSLGDSRKSLQEQLPSMSPSQRAIVNYCLAWSSARREFFELARAEARESGDVDLELAILERRLHNTEGSFAFKQAGYRMVLELLPKRDPERPSPFLRSREKIEDWQSWMAHLLQNQGDSAASLALLREAAAADSSPASVEAACSLLQLLLQIYQAHDAMILSQELRPRILALPSARDRVGAYITYRRAIVFGGQAETDGFQRNTRPLPSSLGGRLYSEMQQDRQFLERILVDLESPEMEELSRRNFRYYRKELLVDLDRLPEAIRFEQSDAASFADPGLKSAAYSTLALLQIVNRQPLAAEESYRQAALACTGLNASYQWLEASAYCVSERRWEKALEFARLAKSFTDNPHELQYINRRIGVVEVEAGRYREAVQSFKAGTPVERPQKKDWADAVGGNESRSIWFDPYQAEALYKTGQPEAALALLTAAMRSDKPNLLYDQWLVHALKLGTWLQELGRLEEARAVLTKTAEVALALRQESPSIGPKSLEHLEALFTTLSGVLVRLNRSGEAPLWLQKLNDLKLLQEQEGNRSDPEAEKLATIQGNLTNLRNQLAKPRDATTRKALELHQESERKAFTETLEHLRARFPEYDRLASLRVTEVPQVQAVLPSDVVVLQMFAAPDGVYLLALSGNQRVSRFSPIPQARLRAAIAAYKAAISQGQESPAAEELGQWLVAPLIDTIKGKRVLWLPSGDLSQVPLDCLPMGGKPLGEQIILSQVYSSDLVRSPRTGNRLVALGAAQGVDLPGTGVELAQLLQLFPQHVDLEGARASLALLTAAAPACDILHLASHAGGDPEHPETDYLDLTGQKLRIADILNLTLRPGCLVFLSACNSGRASSTQISDVNSLANAFRAAGANTVIYTLWPIDDQASVEFVGAFYKEIRVGRPAAQALASAKDHMRHSRFSQPQYWGAFQLIGKDW